MANAHSRVLRTAGHVATRALATQSASSMEAASAVADAHSPACLTPARAPAPMSDPMSTIAEGVDCNVPRHRPDLRPNACTACAPRRVAIRPSFSAAPHAPPSLLPIVGSVVQHARFKVPSVMSHRLAVAAAASALLDNLYALTPAWTTKAIMTTADNVARPALPCKAHARLVHVAAQTAISSAGVYASSRTTMTVLSVGILVQPKLEHSAAPMTMAGHPV